MQLADLNSVCILCVLFWTGTRSHAASSPDCPPQSLASYRMEIRGAWTETNLNSRLLPKEFPDHWRWNTGIGESKSDRIETILSLVDNVFAGVSLDSREDPYYNETVRSKLYNFVNKAGLAHTVAELAKPDSGVLDTFLIPTVESSGVEVATVFFVDSNHSRVSFMMKMNTKPFWMLSVDSINLCENGHFHDIFELDLFPFEIRQRPRPRSQPVGTQRSSSDPGSRGTLVSPKNLKNYAYQPESESLSPVYIHLPMSRDKEKTPSLSLVTPQRFRNTTVAYASQFYLRQPITTRNSHRAVLHSSDKRGGYLYSADVNTGLIHSRPASQTPHKPKDYWERVPALHQQQVEPYRRHYSKHSRKARKKTTTPDPSLIGAVDDPISTNEALTVVKRNAVYSRRAGRSRGYSQNQQLLPQLRHNQIREPEVLPRLATVKFTKMATYHVSQLPGLTRRGSRTEVTPLPITVNRRHLKNPYIPYRGVIGTPSRSAVSQQSASGWPSAHHPHPAYYAEPSPQTPYGNPNWLPQAMGGR